MGAGAAVEILWALAVDRESGRHDEMRKGPSSSSMNGPEKVASRLHKGKSQVAGRRSGWGFCWGMPARGAHWAARETASKRRFISLAGVGVCQDGGDWSAVACL